MSERRHKLLYINGEADRARQTITEICSQPPPPLAATASATKKPTGTKAQIDKNIMQGPWVSLKLLLE